ncbi:hypothetical protein [Allocoleopsis sp.]|uniref:hypothetical protein n=1 Tax=Allocoleopsis sp. TaxID=3088169 RepID=UPI002FD09643
MTACLSSRHSTVFIAFLRNQHSFLLDLTDALAKWGVSLRVREKLLSVSENHTQSKSLRAFLHNDLNGEFLIKIQKCRLIGKTPDPLGLQHLRSPTLFSQECKSRCCKRHHELRSQRRMKLDLQDRSIEGATA